MSSSSSNPHPLPLIHVDTREKERSHPADKTRTVGTNMLSLLQSHPYHPSCQSTLLPAADFSFTGQGPSGPAHFGIERKRTRDMLHSMRSGRFSGEQLPKLFEFYDFVYLIIEGRHRTNFHSGVLEEKQGRNWTPITLGKSTFLGLELDSFLNSLSRNIPLVVLRTRDEHETIVQILSLAHTFSKPWDKHTAHIAIHLPPEWATVGKASTVRRVAYTLDGVGWERSGTIDQHFSSVDQMIQCLKCGSGPTPSYLSKLPGFGKVLSKRVWDQLHGKHEPKGLE